LFIFQILIEIFQYFQDQLSDKVKIFVLLLIEISYSI